MSCILWVSMLYLKVRFVFLYPLFSTREANTIPHYNNIYICRGEMFTFTLSLEVRDACRTKKSKKYVLSHPVYLVFLIYSRLFKLPFCVKKKKENYGGTVYVFWRRIKLRQFPSMSLSRKYFKFSL